MPHPRLAAIPFIFAAAVASGADRSSPGADDALSTQPVEEFAAPPAAGPEGAEASTEAWRDRLAARLQQLANSPSSPSPSEANASLGKRLERLARSVRGQARVALHVRDLRTGATVFDQGGDRLLNPASNHKLLTAVAGLELLGADYRFATRVVRDGDTLYVIGEGDPSLQVDDLYQLAQYVDGATDVSTLSRVVVDDGAFSERFFGPGYAAGGPGVSYMAPSGALSLQFNVVEITVRPQRYGAPVQVEVNPPCAHVRVESTAATGAGRALTADSRRDGHTTVVEVSGRLAAGHAPVVFRKRVVDPGLYAASAFADILGRVAGGPRLEVVRGSAPATAVTVATHHSAELAAVLAPAMKFSNNFTTEQVLRTLGWRHSGSPGDWDNGQAAIAAFWTALGQDPDDLVFENASGLSRVGRVTARALVDVLDLTLRDGSSAAELLTALPVAGRDGTLRKRMLRGQGRVRAKTGTLSGVGALTGVVANDHGQARFGFSILINGPMQSTSSRRLQDRVALALVEHLDRE